MSNKSYWVNLPIAGVLSLNIESAENEEDAIQQALETDFNISLSGSDMELTELESFDKLVTGNVVHAPLWEAEAQEG